MTESKCKVPHVDEEMDMNIENGIELDSTKPSIEDNCNEDGNADERGDGGSAYNASENPTKKGCGSDQLKKMKSTADWWSLWIGLASFSLAMTLVFTVKYDVESTRVKYVIPQPMHWEANPFDAWDWYAVVGTLLLLAYFCLLYIFSLRCMGKLDKNPASQHAKGFLVMGVVATLSLWLGRNKWCSSNGLSYAIFSIIFGMIITNSPVGNWKALSCLKLASKDGEFFIKCSLALLATEFSVLARVGLPAIIVAWVGSPIALITGYIISKKVLKMETDIALLTAVGATWYVLHLAERSLGFASR